MRFRPRLGFQICFQILSLCLWLFIAVGSTAKHHAPTLFGATAALWVALLTAQISSYLSTSWSLDPDGIHRKNLWSSQRIPYADIVAIRPHTDLWKPSPSQIDIEFGKLGSALNPRMTTTANPRQRSIFLEQLRASTPQAAFEL